MCAGAINSPQLLELSGIGQADRLSALGLRIALDLPNRSAKVLQDHYMTIASYRLRTGTRSINQLTRERRSWVRSRDTPSAGGASSPNLPRNWCSLRAPGRTRHP
ncbi:hypothetical protein AB5I41_14900 [Sphingomonas sp. MMS24-JH45]